MQYMAVFPLSKMMGEGVGGAGRAEDVIQCYVHPRA